MTVKQHMSIGLVAHVDAGKTTLSEALLYTSGARRTLGRVDHADAFLDTHALERGAENKILLADREDVLPMLQKQAYMPLAETAQPVHTSLIDDLSRQVPLWKLACNKEPQAAIVAWEGMHI